MKDLNVVIFVPRIVTMVYVMSKNTLLSLKIVAIVILTHIIHEDIRFSYNFKI